MQKFLKAISIFVLLILSTAVSGLAEEIGEPYVEPFSPEFLKWQEEHQYDNDADTFLTTRKSAPNEEYSSGYIPFHIDLSHLADNPPIEEEDDSQFLKRKNTTLPSKYDLRNVNGKNYVTSVKNQNPYGTCWAHAAIGAMESNMLMKGLGINDFSEMHLAWFAFRGDDKTKTFYNLHGSSFTNVMNKGGNSLYPTALFTRFAGPTTEAEVPYKSGQPSKGTPESYTRAARLRDVYYFSPMANDELNINTISSIRDIVKRRIMDNGAVVGSYYSDQSQYHKTASNGTSYYVKNESPNHAIQIIGWDDNYSHTNFKTDPIIDGAWLIKNSWGDTWWSTGDKVNVGDNGCFWMSYAQYLTEGTAFITEKVDPDMKVYDYSPLGWCMTWGYDGNGYIYAANVFKAERDNEVLKEVGFYTTTNNISYQIDIYTGMTSMPSSSPLNGSSVLRMLGTMPYTGWHTVTLDKPVTLKKGEYFSIVIAFANYTHIAVERSSSVSPNVKIEDGSFFSTNGVGWDTGKSQNQNATIKAFTVTGSSTATKPTITTTSLAEGKTVEYYSQTLTATGTDPITWTATGLPDGLSISKEGLISGTPTTAGTYNVTVTATNSAGSASKSYTLTIKANSGTAPVITTTSLPDGTVGTYYRHVLTMSGTEPVTWTGTGLPDGLTFSDAGIILGTPTTPGTYTVYALAYNAFGSDQKFFTLKIAGLGTPPSITTASLPDGTVGTEYGYTMQATGTTPITWAAYGLPDGLYMSPAGQIAGKPTTTGLKTVTITATNTAGTASKSYGLLIRPSGTAPEVTMSSFPSGQVDIPYHLKIAATGTEPFTWKAEGLPAGMGVVDGWLTGTPRAAGTFEFTVNVYNYFGSTSKACTLTIAPSYLPPLITTPMLHSGTAGTNYSKTLTASGTAPITWTVSGLPDGMNANTSGVIGGKPNAAGNYTVSVTASNSYGSDTKTFALEVLKGVQTPVITTTALADGQVGIPYSQPITTTGTEVMTFSAARFPTGLGFATSTSDIITGIPTVSGVFNVKIKVSNSAGTVEKGFTLTVKDPGTTPSIVTPMLNNGIVGSAYCQNLTASGASPIKWSASGLPTGLSLSPSDDFISGTPTTADTYTVKVTATNSYGSSSKSFTLTVTASGTPPSITTASLPDAQVGTAYSQTLKASGTTPITWSISSGNASSLKTSSNGLPGGLSLNSSTGLISGTPTTAGSYTFTVTAKNNAGSVSKSFTITVTGIEQLDTVNLTGYVGYTLKHQLTPNSSTWSALDRLPSGLSLSRSGLISGRPSKAGTYSVKIQAKSSSSVSQLTVKFTINPKPVKPTIRTSSLPNGVVGTAYSRKIETSGTDPITLTVQGLPKGLAFDSGTATISGTPSEAGTFSLKVTAENLATELDNRAVTKTIRLVIKAQPPVIKSPGTLPKGIVKTAYENVQFTTSSGTEPIKWTASGLPSGLRMSSSGLLSGTPTRAGNFNMTVRASNSGGNNSLRVPVTIIEKPSVSSPRMSNATTDRAYTARFNAKGTTPIKWTFEGLPDTLTVTPNATGSSVTVKGTPVLSDTYTVKMKLENEAGSEEYTMTFKVNGVAPRITASLARGNVGRSYSETRISAKGTKPIEITCSIADSDLKKFGINGLSDLGLTFTCDAEEGTAKITGTPSMSIKNLPLTFTATNVISSAKRKLNLTLAGERPSFITPSSATTNMTCEIGSNINISFKVKGSKKIVYSMNNVSGFTLTQTNDYEAVLTGKAPSRDSTTTITVKAKNPDGSATRRIVIKTQTPPEITTDSLPSATIKKNYSAKVKATGTKTVKLSVEGNLPTGLRFSNGSFSGRPTEAGEYTFTVKAVNKIGEDSKQFTIEVVDPNAPKVSENKSVPEKNSTPPAEDTKSSPESVPENKDLKPEESVTTEHKMTFGEGRASGSQTAQIEDEGYIIAAVLPEVSVNVSGMYDISVELSSDVPVGAKLIWLALAEEGKASEDDTIAEFYDDTGAETAEVPANRKITVSAWFNEGVKYSPVIAVK